jgi:hypothetical protein
MLIIPGGGVGPFRKAGAARRLYRIDKYILGDTRSPAKKISVSEPEYPAFWRSSFGGLHRVKVRSTG